MRDYKGYWIECEDQLNDNLWFRHWICSSCYSKIYFIRSNGKFFKYCPFCGVEKEEKNETYNNVGEYS